MTSSVARAMRCAVAVLYLQAAGSSAQAQDVESRVDVERQTAESGGRLRARIEETWRVVPIEAGVLLVPRRPIGDVQGVELGPSRLAINGIPASGADLVSRLGAAAEPVLQLSYLSPTERSRLFAPREATGPPADRRAPTRVTEAPGYDGPPEGRLRRTPIGARVRVGGSVRVNEGEHVQDVVAVFGDVDFNGEADGNVVAIGGDVRLGPKAVVRGDLASIGGQLIGADEARVAGTVTEVAWAFPDFRVMVGDRDHVVVQVWPDWPRIARVQWVVGLALTVICAILSVFTVVIAPRAVDTVRLQSRPLILAWLLGLAAQALFVPALVVIVSALTLSVLGIPLLAAVPLLVVAFAAAGMVGFAGVTVRAGAVFLPGGLGQRAPLLALVPGLALVLGVGLLGRYLLTLGPSPLGAVLALVGVVIEHTVWSVGLGAVVLAWVRRPRRQSEAQPIEHPLPATI